MSIRCGRPRLLLVLLCFAVGCRGDPAGPLIAQLNDSNAELRLSALEALESYEGGNVTAALAALIEDPDPDVRELAIQSLGQRGQRSLAHLPKLVDALQHPDPNTRLVAAFAVRRIDTEGDAHVPIFLAAIEAGQPRALLELGNNRANDDWAVQPLIELLSHRNPKVRALSAMTLGRLGSLARPATEALQQAKSDPEPNVRKMAEQALGQIAAAQP